MPRQKLLNGFVDMFVCLCLCVCVHACVMQVCLSLSLCHGWACVRPTLFHRTTIDILAISRMLCVYIYIIYYISCLFFFTLGLLQQTDKKNDSESLGARAH